MKKEETMRNPVQSKLVMAALVAMLALPTSAWCVEDPNLAIGFIGVVPGQTARVQLVNSRADFSCQVKIQFVGTDGQVLVTGEPVTVGPGKSTKLQIPGEALGSGRTEIVPVFTFVDPGPCRKRALVSAEVLEGATVKVFYAPVCVLPPGPAAPPNPIRFGLIHIAAGQAGSIRAYEDPNEWGVEDPEIRTVQIRFFDAAGRLLTSKMAALGPTGSVALDFSGTGGAVRAEVGLIPPGPPVGIVATGEIVDKDTATTAVAWPPPEIERAATGN
jgi:hypothetical protein